jgi:hypothetical protein
MWNNLRGERVGRGGEAGHREAEKLSEATAGNTSKPSERGKGRAALRARSARSARQAQRSKKSRSDFFCAERSGGRGGPEPGAATDAVGASDFRLDRDRGRGGDCRRG